MENRVQNSGRPVDVSSRLVFVSVQGAKSKRKVAVPITDGMEWQTFVDTVRLKLKLSGVGDVYLASTGETVKGLEQLNDIDEVHVVETVGAMDPSVVMEQQRKNAEITPGGGSQKEEESVYASKYVKKQSDLQRAMKRMMPGLFMNAGSLPVTTKDTNHTSSSTAGLSPIEQVKRRIKKRNAKRSILDPRTVLAVFALLSCAATLLFVYLRATHDLNVKHVE